MKNINVLKSLDQYSDAQKKALKKETKAFMAAAMKNKNITSMKYVNRYDNDLVMHVPFSLIVIPEYQIERHDTNATHVNEIVSAYENMKMDKITLNYRTQGKNAGYLYVVDGQHRCEALNLLKDTDVVAYIVGLDHDDEIAQFAKQDEGIKTVSPWIKYEARLLMDPKSKEGTRPRAVADRIIHETFKAMKVHPRYDCNLAVKSFEDLLTDKGSKVVNDAEQRCAWLADVIINSRYYMTARGRAGLTSSCIAGINRVYLDIGRGVFGDIDYDEAARLAKKALFKETDASILLKLNEYLFRTKKGVLRGGSHVGTRRIQMYIEWKMFEELGLSFLDIIDNFLQ